MPLLGLRTYDVLRRGPVTYVDGLAVRPAPTTLQVRLSVQPMRGTELERVPEGLRSRRPRKAYGYRDVPLRTVQDPDGEADLVVIDGERFEVHRARDYGEHAPLPHLRYELYRAETDEDLEVGP